MKNLNIYVESIKKGDLFVSFDETSNNYNLTNEHEIISFYEDDLNEEEKTFLNKYL